MPDLDEFQTSNESNRSKLKETKQNALFVFERTVSLSWCGLVQAENNQREVIQKWVFFWKITQKIVSKN